MLAKLRLMLTVLDQSPGPEGLRGNPAAYIVREREQPSLSDPVGQKGARPASIHHLGHVRAGIA